MTGSANNVGELRRGRRVSAIQLAAAAGVSRQTIHAIESGTFVPNTVVALRMARALETTVEQLFLLPESEPAPKTLSQQAKLLKGPEAPRPGQPVQLCRVNKRLIASTSSPVPWYFPAADGAVASMATSRESARIQVFERGDFTNRILLAGCDPGIPVLSRHVQSAGVELVLAHRNSSQALHLLKEGTVHIAGTHLRDDTTGESNLPAISRLFAKGAVAVISFALWEEGFVTAPGNPKRIRAADDLARKSVSIVNREVGSGSRSLLDSQLRQAGITGQNVRGYNSLASGHLPAAWQVQSGAADCCIATGAVARLLGLHFVPLVSERYDFVVRRRHLVLAPVQLLFDTLSRSGLRRELEALGGYDTSVSGHRLL